MTRLCPPGTRPGAVLVRILARVLGPGASAALGLDDEGLRRRLGDDFRRVAAKYAGPDLGLSPGATWKSPFGIERDGHRVRPAPLPSPPQRRRRSATSSTTRGRIPTGWTSRTCRAEAESWGGEFAILGGDWSPFWHDVIDFVGLERLYYMMYDEPEVASLLFEKVTRLLLRGEPADVRGRGARDRHLLHRQRLRLADGPAPRAWISSSVSPCRPCSGSSISVIGSARRS